VAEQRKKGNHWECLAELSRKKEKRKGEWPKPLRVASSRKRGELLLPPVIFNTGDSSRASTIDRQE